MAQTVREKALIRQAREDGRPSEDDVAQERLGWRGQKGRPRPAMMTEEGKLQTSPDLRSRPHGLIPAEPRAIDRGIPLRTVTEPTQSGLACAGEGPAAKRKTPPTAGLKFWDERTQRVVELVPPTAMRNLARGSALP